MAEKCVKYKYVRLLEHGVLY